ncbi:hypothetical protein C8J57DRAFT_1234063 [Mycena rebaudengoi]|nr:hypothetical protein C8J57DRAFT_1240537 [Mycena rebaudengoi]KAJ7259074.1 hypothetical protein C8J57DRAFT_1234063 [Mycena rebaudengoi]
MFGFTAILSASVALLLTVHSNALECHSTAAFATIVAGGESHVKPVRLDSECVGIFGRPFYLFTVLPSRLEHTHQAIKYLARDRVHLDRLILPACHYKLKYNATRPGVKPPPVLPLAPAPPLWDEVDAQSDPMCFLPTHATQAHPVSLWPNAPKSPRCSLFYSILDFFHSERSKHSDA